MIDEKTLKACVLNLRQTLAIDCGWGSDVGFNRGKWVLMVSTLSRSKSKQLHVEISLTNRFLRLSLAHQLNAVKRKAINF